MHTPPHHDRLERWRCCGQERFHEGGAAARPSPRRARRRPPASAPSTVGASAAASAARGTGCGGEWRRERPCTVQHSTINPACRLTSLPSSAPPFPNCRPPRRGRWRSAAPFLRAGRGRGGRSGAPWALIPTPPAGARGGERPSLLPPSLLPVASVGGQQAAAGAASPPHSLPRATLANDRLPTAHRGSSHVSLHICFFPPWSPRCIARWSPEPP